MYTVNDYKLLYIYLIYPIYGAFEVKNNPTKRRPAFMKWMIEPLLKLTF
jgi:hypothetical protein